MAESSGSDSLFSFGVHRVASTDDGLSIAGRCLTGPVHVGSVFRRARPGPGHPGESSHPADLVVVAIHAYGHLLAELDTGLTASLVVRGQAPQGLGDGWVLDG